MSEVHPLRLRFGVARFDDGWNVVVEVDGSRRVYDPTFATEAEALAVSHGLAETIRAAMRRDGIAFGDWPPP